MNDKIINPTEQQVRERAHQYWEQREGGHGLDQVDWFNAEKRLFIDQNYDLIACYKFESCDRKDFGLTDAPTCRYCGKNRPEVKFKRGNAHAIPNFLGNTRLFSYDECRSCNALFSNYETSMGDLTVSLRKHMRLGSPKVPNESLRIDLQNRSLSFANNDKISVYPIKIFKLLTKCALAIMPKKGLVEFDRTIEWILDQDHSNYFRKRAPPIPGALFLLRARNIAFQIPIPLCNADGNNITLTFPYNPPFPVFPKDRDPPHTETHLLNGHEKIAISNVVQLAFDSFETSIKPSSREDSSLN